MKSSPYLDTFIYVFIMKLEKSYSFSNLFVFALNLSTSFLLDLTDLGLIKVLEKLSEDNTKSLLISRASINLGRYLQIRSY